MRDFFGTDRTTVTVINPDAEITRTFTSFSEMAKSVEDARVWAGIHFRSADIDGIMGRQVNRTMTNFMPADCEVAPVTPRGSWKDRLSWGADAYPRRSVRHLGTVCGHTQAGFSSSDVASELHPLTSFSPPTAGPTQ